MNDEPRPGLNDSPLPAPTCPTRRCPPRSGVAAPSAAAAPSPPWAARSPPAPSAPARSAALRVIPVSPSVWGSNCCPSVVMLASGSPGVSLVIRRMMSQPMGAPTPRTQPATTLPFLGRSSSLSDQVAGVLAERVLTGAWPAGHRLPSEPELVETFGVSRSVVRDAVRSLAARGLVEVRQGYGTVVRGEPEEPYADALLDLLVRSDVTLADLAKAREA